MSHPSCFRNLRPHRPPSSFVRDPEPPSPCAARVSSPCASVKVQFHPDNLSLTSITGPAGQTQEVRGKAGTFFSLRRLRVPRKLLGGLLGLRGEGSPLQASGARVRKTQHGAKVVKLGLAPALCGSFSRPSGTSGWVQPRGLGPHASSPQSIPLLGPCSVPTREDRGASNPGRPLEIGVWAAPAPPRTLGPQTPDHGENRAPSLAVGHLPAPTPAEGSN